MVRKTILATALIAAAFLIGCGTSSAGPGGSAEQTRTGVSSSGYPAGEPKDEGSPALGSSTEQKYAREEGEKKEEK